MYAKHLLPLLCGLCLAVPTQAQFNLDSALSVYNDLDWSHFQTGLLYNRIPFNRLHDLQYKGNPFRFHRDSTRMGVSAAVFEQLYNDFAYADRYQNFFDTAFSFEAARVDWAARGDVPIGLLAFEFDYLTPEAMEQQWISFDTLSGRFYHPGDTLRFQDSIPTDSSLQNTRYLDTTIYRPGGGFTGGSLGKTHVVAISLLDRAVGLKSLAEPVKYFVPASVFNEAQNLVSLVEIDFDDGNGWRKLEEDAEYTVFYTSFGIKQVRVRSILPGYDAGTVRATFEVNVYQAAPDAGLVVEQFTPASCASQLDTQGAGAIRLSVRYAPGNTSLQKPVLLVEDFDERLLQDAQGNPAYNSKVQGYGSVGYQSLQVGLVFDEAGNEIFKYNYSKHMTDSLLAAGFDLVFVDFKDPRASVATNGKAVFLAIDWVNQQLGYAKSFSAIGLGTGGLMLNYALNRYEEGGCCHHVDKFISFDTPYKGLNIPLALQHHARYYNTGNTPDGKLFGAKGTSAKKIEELLRSPLMQDIVVYNLERAKLSERTALDPLPKDCYNIAIANGSLQGNTFAFAQGNDLFRMGVAEDLSLFGSLAGGILFYRRSTPLAIHARNKGQSQQLVNYIDAGTTHNGLYHRTRNKILGVTLTALALFAALVAAFQLVGLGVGSLVIAAAAIVNAGIRNTYNNRQDYISIQEKTLAYDHAPGSRATALGGLFSSERSYLYRGYDIGDAHSAGLRSEFSLVPTVSALGIDTEDLTMNINGLTTSQKEEKIPFEKYYQDPEQGNSHQYHVEFTEQNAQFMVNELRAAAQAPFSSLEQALDRYYNYGREEENVLGQVQVQSGGTLALNDKNPWGYAGQGGTSPRLDESIEIYTKVCGSHIEVENNGLLSLGSSSYSTSTSGQLVNQRAELYVRAGSVLELKAGATLVVRDSSRLLILPGAELLVHPGASIELDGAGAVLELQGKLRLKANAVLQPSGSGILRFNQNMQANTAAQFLAFEGNNALLLSSPLGDAHTRLQVWQNTWFTPALDSLAVQNLRVELRQGVFMAVQGTFFTENTHYTKSPEDVYKHEGLRLFGQAGATVHHCSFTSGNYGLLALLATYGQPLTLRHCTFRYCGNGLETRGKRAWVYNSTFEDNAAGWLGRDHDGECRFFESTARNCNSGIRFNGQAGSRLVVSNAVLNTNQNGLEIEGAALRSVCSDYRFNLYGIRASQSSLDLSDRAQNRFDNSYEDILLDEAEACLLHQGFNRFAQGNNYLTGTLSANAIPTLYNSGSGYALRVQDNDMPATGGSVAVRLSLNGAGVGLYNWSPMLSYPNFCSGQTAGGNLCAECAGKTLLIPPAGGLRLEEAVPAAIAYLVDHPDEGTPEDNLRAMDALQTIMDYIREAALYGPQDEGPGSHYLDASERMLMDYAFAYYMAALSNAYRLEVLRPNRAVPGQEADPYLQYIVHEATYRLDHQVPDSEAPYQKGFYFQLAQPHAFRIGEHYDHALAGLAEAGSWASGPELALAQYWTCVFEAEEALILEEIDMESFLVRMAQCISNSAGKRGTTAVALPQEGVAISAVHYPPGDALRFRIFPNPAKGSFSLQLEGAVGAYTYKVYNLQGTRLAEGALWPGPNHLQLDKDLAGGVYTLAVEKDGQTLGSQRLVLLP